MTKTAWELWFDDAFLVERIKQQEHYLLDLELRHVTHKIDDQRFFELYNTAMFIKARFEHQFQRPHPIEFDYTENTTKLLKEYVETN
jgi:hypothetical protein